MKYLYTIVMAMLVLASCSENERMVYTDTPGIYFPDYVVGADSLVYSFRMKDTDRDCGAWPHWRFPGKSRQGTDNAYGSGI